MKRKWLILALGLAAPVYAATLKGVVTAEGAPVSDARILVFHGMTSSLFVHKGKSDRNGRYFFSLDPGPYRVFVLKKGFAPDKQEKMIFHHEEAVSLEHDLDLTGPVEPSLVVKDMLRKNKEPHKSLAADVAPEVTLAPPALDQSLIGTVETRSLRGLDGNVGHSSSVQVRTQLTNSVQLASSVINERRQGLPDDAYQIKAGVAVDLDRFEFGVDAESITAPGAEDAAGSRAMSLTGAYGHDVQLRGSVSLKQSQNLADQARERELNLDQQVSYNLADHPITHHVAYTDWERDSATLARHAAVSTQWRHGRLEWLGVQSDLEHFSLRDASVTTAKMWLMGETDLADDRLSVKTRLGVHSEEDHVAPVHHSQISAAFGPFSLYGEALEDYGFESFSAIDVFGEYLPQPLTPYANESFYKTRTRQASLRMALEHGDGWSSGFSWRRADDQASRLYAHDLSIYRPQTGRETQEYAYSLATDRYGSRIEINHSRNANDAMRYDQVGLRYSQALSPFSQRGMGVLLELQMRNAPGLPAWWLLQELPWDKDEEGAWFEGHLSVQF